MNIDVFTLSDLELQNQKFKQTFVMNVNGKTVLSFSDGELNDGILNIPKLMKLAYDAGKNNEEFNIKRDHV